MNNINSQITRKRLAPLILEAFAEIRAYFPNSHSYLGIDTDPDMVGNDNWLITIIADLEPDEAFKTLQNFDNDWWIHNLDRAQGCLNIFLELRGVGD